MMIFGGHPLDLESLRCFEAAATLLSFRGGAQQVGLSPAAFSERIRRLEDDLGVRLFERTTRRVRLTEPGVRLLPEARSCLAQADQCRLAVLEPGAPQPVELSVGTRFELGMSWLVPSLTPLEAHLPGLTLHLSFGRSDDLVEALLAGTLDSAITSARLTQADLDYIPLHEERYVFVASPKRLAQSPLSCAAQARAHTLLDIDRDLPLYRYWRDAMPDAELMTFHRRVFLGTIAAIRHRVLDGAGVAVLPHYFVRGDIDAGRLIPLMTHVEPGRDHFRLVWRRGHPRGDVLREVAAFLKARPLK